LEDLKAQMGDSLISLTYGEAGMGYPEDLTGGGISWRVMTYYDLPMGGAAANGVDAGNIGTVDVNSLTANPISMIADLEITSKVSGTNNKIADITVKVTAKKVLPAKAKLHIIVFQTRLNWQDEYGMTPSNGQIYMVNAVRDLVSDSTGEPVSALAAGEAQSITKTFTADPKVKYPDSLRVSAILQVEDTKEILSVSQTKKSPLGISPIVVSHHILNKTELEIASAGFQKIGVTLPFSNASVRIYTTAGRIVKSQNCIGVKGQRVSITLPEADGVFIIKLFAGKDLYTVFTVPSNGN